MSNDIRRLGKQFKVGRQEDAHEYLITLLDCLKEEILKVNGVRLCDGEIADSTYISRIFGGSYCNQLKCTKCKYKSITYNNFLDLSLNVGGGINSIKAGIDSFCKEERLSSGNEWKCDGCKKKVQAVKEMKIHAVPNVLIVHFNRFSFDRYAGKISKPIDFKMNLQVYSNEENKNVDYELFGVIEHLGSSVHSGHYVAYVKGSNGLWHEMNDERVNVVSVDHVPKKKAYILFYNRKNVKVEAAALAAAPSAPAPTPTPLPKVEKKEVKVAPEPASLPKAPVPVVAPVAPTVPKPAQKPESAAKGMSTGSELDDDRNSKRVVVSATIDPEDDDEGVEVDESMSTDDSDSDSDSDSDDYEDYENYLAAAKARRSKAGRNSMMQRKKSVLPLRLLCQRNKQLGEVSKETVEPSSGRKRSLREMYKMEKEAKKEKEDSSDDMDDDDDSDSNDDSDCGEPVNKLEPEEAVSSKVMETKVVETAAPTAVYATNKPPLSGMSSKVSLNEIPKLLQTQSNRGKNLGSEGRWDDVDSKTIASVAAAEKAIIARDQALLASRQVSELDKLLDRGHEKKIKQKKTITENDTHNYFQDVQNKRLKKN